MTRSKTLAVATSAIVGLMALAGLAVSAQQPAPTVAGQWQVSIDSPHGAMTATLSLAVNGTKVTGTCSNPHGGEALAVDGQFSNGQLTMNTSIKMSDEVTMPLTFTGTLKDDTLEGTLSSSGGDMTWTAKRATSGASKSTMAELHAHVHHALMNSMPDSVRQWLLEMHHSH